MSAKLKRSGASLINVLVFMLAAVMITAQVFFFFEREMQTTTENSELLLTRMRLESIVQEAKKFLTPKAATADYKTFYENTKLDIDPKKFPKDYWNDKYHVAIHSLNYSLEKKSFNSDEWLEIAPHERIFPAMKPDGQNYYLIRAYAQLSAQNYLMHQVLVCIDGSKIETKTYEEIWYSVDSKGNWN